MGARADEFDTAKAAHGSSAEPSPEDTPEAVMPGRVLVVDDEQGACEALEAVLREEGYEVATASNPFQGLDLLGKVRPHVVLTELRMPGLDGLVFMERVRELSPATRIVVMTAFGSVGAAVGAMKRGADDFLEKPIDEEALCDAVRSSVKRASLLGEAHAALWRASHPEASQIL